MASTPTPRGAEGTFRRLLTIFIESDHDGSRSLDNYELTEVKVILMYLCPHLNCIHFLQALHNFYLFDRRKTLALGVVQNQLNDYLTVVETADEQAVPIHLTLLRHID